MVYEEFFRSFQVNGRYKYRELIQALPVMNGISLVIDFEDLLSYDRSLAHDLLDNPDKHIEEAGEAIKRVVAHYDDEYANEVRRFYPRFRGLPDEAFVDLGDVRSRHVGKLVVVSGIVSKTSMVKHVIIEGSLRCPVCGTEFKVMRDEDGKIRTTGRCPNPDCEYEGKMMLLKEKSAFMDIQRVFIQEKPENLSPGQLPRSIEVVMAEDLVNTVQPGNIAIVVGVVRLEKEYAGQEFFSYIDANYVEVREKNIDDMEITKDDEARILELGKDPLIIDKIIDSISPSIYGYRHIKESIAYQLFGGIPKVTADKTKIRGNINILLVGDPGTGKSQLLRYVAQIAPRGVYASGKGSSTAGLTATVVRDKITNEFYLEAGVLVLADGGIACIDELDKMDASDRDALHEAMEQQTISIAKAGIVATLNARTSVLASANPRLGRFDINRPFSENVNLPETLLSRFDLIWPFIDTVNSEHDDNLSKHIILLHQRPETFITPPIPADLLKKYIVYARRYIKPRLSEEAGEKLREFYKEIRGKAANDVIPITARELEAMIRLSEARAKMRLSNTVTAEDANAIINLMKKMLQEVYYDRTIGTYNTDIIYAKLPRSKKDLIQTIEEIIKNAGEIEKEQLINMMQNKGINEDKTEEAIKHLLNEGTIFEPKPGYLRYTKA
jgi:replicative DNA helicase Mcm